MKRERKRFFWEKHLKEWRASGLSQAEYCRLNKLRIKSFAYWKKKEKADEQPVVFVPVSFDPPSTIKNDSSIKVIVNERYVIEVCDGFTPLTLRQIVKVLEAA